MNKKIALSVLALLVVGLIATGVYAYGFRDRDSFNETRNETIDKMQDAIESGDYDAWLALHQEMEANRVRITDLITAENFDRFREMHELREQGDFEGAQAIAEELGLEQMRMGRRGMFKHSGDREGLGLRDGSCQRS